MSNRPVTCEHIVPVITASDPCFPPACVPDVYRDPRCAPAGFSTVAPLAVRRLLAAVKDRSLFGPPAARALVHCCGRRAQVGSAGCRQSTRCLLAGGGSWCRCCRRTACYSAAPLPRPVALALIVQLCLVLQIFAVGQPAAADPVPPGPPTSVTLRADRRVISAGESAVLTATTDVGVALSGSSIKIIDQTANKQLKLCSSGSSCSVSTTFATGGTHVYVAQVNTHPGVRLGHGLAGAVDDRAGRGRRRAGARVPGGGVGEPGRHGEPGRGPHGRRAQGPSAHRIRASRPHRRPQARPQRCRSSADSVIRLSGGCSCRISVALCALPVVGRPRGARAPAAGLRSRSGWRCWHSQD